MNNLPLARAAAACDNPACVNIAHVIFQAEPQRGGAERYCDDLCRALLARNHKVTVLASRFGTIAANASEVRINGHGAGRTGQYHRFLSNLDAHLAANRYDVVHAHLPVTRCDVYHAHAGLETISLQHGHRSRPTLARQLTAMLGSKLSRKRRAFADVESRLLHSAKPPITICLTHRERNEAAALFPTAANRIVTLNPVPDDSRFPASDLERRRKLMRKRLGLTAEQPMFLFIGQDFDRKGLATAIRALGRLHDRRALLYVLGGGDVARFTKVAVSADVVGRVLFAGTVTNVSDFLAAADGLVLPTRSEPFGMVTIEAMLCGVPPIISAVAGSSEIVDDDRTGYVVQALHDPAQWALAMARVLDPQTHDRLSAACLASRPRFSYDAHVDAIEALYKRAIAERV